MSDEQVNAYFDSDSLKKMIEAEGKTVAAVLCYLWQNSINKNDVIELIDNVELLFTDKSRLTFSSNEDNTGMLAHEFDFDKEKKEIELEFGGKIKIIGLNASPTKMWTDVIDKKLIAVRLTKQGEYYLSDSVMLDFGEERRTISISPVDGLIIDFWEED